MGQIDAFASELFEEAKRFLEKARYTEDEESRNAFLHAALLLGFSSLEAYVNAISEEMRERLDLSIMDKSVLLEKEFSFDKGQFYLNDRLKIYSLIDRILFLSKKFAVKGKQLDLTADWWSKLHQGIAERNSLVHPREKNAMTYEKVKAAFDGILGTLDALYIVIYSQRFPSFGRQLDSTMIF